MADTLLGLILERLAVKAEPVLLRSEIQHYSPKELRALLSLGILQEASALDQPRDKDDEIGEPAEKQERGHKVHLTGLVEMIRHQNDLEGDPLERWPEILYFVGEKSPSPERRVGVYLYVPNEALPLPQAWMELNLMNPRPLVMLVPVPIPLDGLDEMVIGPSVVVLSKHLKVDSWQLPLDRFAREDAGWAKPLGSVHCSVFKREKGAVAVEAKLFTRAQYDELLKRRNSFQMFIDGFGPYASKIDLHGKRSGVVPLGEQQFDMLSHYIRTRKRMCPHLTEVRGDHTSQESANRQFNYARRKADVRLDSARRPYRAFKKFSGIRKVQWTVSYQFDPDPEVTYCLIVPLLRPEANSPTKTQ